MSVHTEASFDELLLEKRWRRCAPPWEAGARRPAGGVHVLLPELLVHPSPRAGQDPASTCRDAQIETVDTWLHNRYVVVLKARQIGFSTLIATYCFWLTFFYPDRAVVMISKTERESAKLLQKAKYGYRFLPDWMKLRGPMRIENTQAKLTWSQRVRHRIAALGQSTLDVASPCSSSSWTRSATCPTRKRRTPPSSRSPTSVGGSSCSAPPTAKATCCTSCGSTARPGQPLQGHLLPVVGRGPRPGLVRRQEGRAAAVADGPGVPRQPRRSVPTLRQPRLRRGRRPRHRARSNHGRGATSGSPRTGPASSSPTAARWPCGSSPSRSSSTSSGPTSRKAWSTATTSSAHVIDATNRRVVATYHAHVDADLFGIDILQQLGLWYNQALIGVESNNHGLTMPQRVAGRRSTATSTASTVTCSGSSRRPSCSAGAPRSPPRRWPSTSWARRSATATWRSPTTETIAELRTFVREGNGRMHGSPFDDRTMSAGHRRADAEARLAARVPGRPDAGAGDDGLPRAAACTATGSASATAHGDASVSAAARSAHEPSPARCEGGGQIRPSCVKSCAGCGRTLTPDP